jgi:hypothetical protein
MSTYTCAYDWAMNSDEARNILCCNSETPKLIDHDKDDEHIQAFIDAALSSFPSPPLSSESPAIAIPAADYVVEVFRKVDDPNN